MPDQKPCPNCKKKIDTSLVLCPYCGLNVETGESYSARMRRAKSYRKESGMARKSLAFGFFLLFAIILIAGFIYQSRIIKGVKKSPKQYYEKVKTLNRANALILNEEYSLAEKRLETLIENLKEEKGQLQEEKDSSDSKKYRHEHRILLSNLIAKAKNKLAKIKSNNS